MFRLALMALLAFVLSGCGPWAQYLPFYFLLVGSEGTPPPPVEEVMTPPPTLTSCQVRTDWFIYTVVRGDTLANIAQRIGSTSTILAQANCLANANIIYAGQQLRVPSVVPTVTPAPAQAQIVAFRVIAAGPNQALEWQTTGTSSVNILLNGTSSAPGTVHRNLPANGTLPISLGPEYAPEAVYTLFPLDANGNQIPDPQNPNDVLQASVTVAVEVNISFSAAPNPVAQGGNVTLSWSGPGTMLFAIARSRADQAGYDVIATDLASSGSTSVTVPMEYSGMIEFVVFPNGGDPHGPLARSVLVSILSPEEPEETEVAQP